MWGGCGEGVSSHRALGLGKGCAVKMMYLGAFWVALLTMCNIRDVTKNTVSTQVYIF